MVPEQAAIANAYLDHLTSEDLVLLVPGGSDALRSGRGPAFLHLHPEGLEELLASPRAFNAERFSMAEDPGEHLGFADLRLLGRSEQCHCSVQRQFQQVSQSLGSLRLLELDVVPTGKLLEP